MSAQIIEVTPVQLPTKTEGQSAFELAIRKAKALTSSTIVPEAYRGEKNLGNAMIVMDVAERMGIPPLLAMQNMYIVQGKPSWSSTFLIATVNACGRFSPLRFEVVGHDPANKDYKVRAIAKDKESGLDCVGPWITWKLVDAEGWSKKNGSKWNTMPELMFLYRAAGFWTRVYAPEVSMGILTREEAEDVFGGNSLQSPPAATQHESLKALEADLTGVDTATGEVLVTKDEVIGAILNAEDLDELDAAADMIRMLPEADRKEADEEHRQRRVALVGAQ